MMVIGAGKYPSYRQDNPAFAFAFAFDFAFLIKHIGLLFVTSVKASER